MSFVFHGTLSLHGGCISSLSGVPLIVHAACILCSDPPHHQDRALKVKVLTLPGEYAPIYTQNTLAHVIGRVHPPLWGMDANVVIVATGIIPSPHTTLAAPGNGYNYHFVIVGTVMEQLANRRLSLGIGGPTALLPWTIMCANLVLMRYSNLLTFPTVSTSSNILILLRLA